MAVNRCNVSNTPYSVGHILTQNDVVYNKDEEEVRIFENVLLGTDDRVPTAGQLMPCYPQVIGIFKNQLPGRQIFWKNLWLRIELEFEQYPYPEEVDPYITVEQNVVRLLVVRQRGPTTEDGVPLDDDGSEISFSDLFYISNPNDDGTYSDFLSPLGINRIANWEVLLDDFITVEPTNNLSAVAELLAEGTTVPNVSIVSVVKDYVFDMCDRYTKLGEVYTSDDDHAYCECVMNGYYFCMIAKHGTLITPPEYEPGSKNVILKKGSFWRMSGVVRQ